MPGHGSKFERKMEAAIVALLTQRNMEEAAQAVGVDVKTLMRWNKVPEFQAAYLEARRAAYSQAIARLQQASSAAAATLMRIMVDPAAPASSKVRAAECILDRALRGIEVEDLAYRIGVLEQSTSKEEQ
jgi:hypothetical protein